MCSDYVIKQSKRYVIPVTESGEEINIAIHPCSLETIIKTQPGPRPRYWSIARALDVRVARNHPADKANCGEKTPRRKELLSMMAAR